MDPLVGKVLNGRFKILEPLGVGGMGRVYKAMQSPLDRLVALKVLNPNYSSGKDPGFQKRFFLEASLTAKLHHPNTITIHDYGCTEDGVFYIAMEYVEGTTLAQLLSQEGSLPWDRVLYIAQQVCRSLREAHKLGIVHRDLKPANVMVINEESYRDVVKVLDFGLVKPFLDDSPVRSDVTELTQAGVLLGSPVYMAPEQARNESDPRSDVYSLGVMMFQMLCGKPPFQAKESIDVIVKHLREEPPDLKSLKPELPDEVATLVHRCLKKNPADRFQSMDELLLAMRSAASQLGISSSWNNMRSAVMSGVRSVSASMIEGAAPSLSELRPVGSSSVHSTRNERNARVAEKLASLERQKKRTGKGTIALAVIGSIAVGGLGLYTVFDNLAGTKESGGSNAPAPSPAPVEAAPGTTPASSGPQSGPDIQVTDTKIDVKPPRDREPAKAVLRITSNPLGARVAMDGRPLGQTPLVHSVPRGHDGSVAAELTFTLDGYENATFLAKGSGPEIEVNQSLVKKRGSGSSRSGQGSSQRQKDPAGYKEDPYQ